MQELISLLQAELCQSHRMVLGTVQGEILLRACPILSTPVWALISTYLEKLLTGGASDSGNGQAVPRKGKWTNALSLTRRSSPMSVSSHEPKNCQPVWPLFISVYVLPICQSDTGRCIQPSWQKASTNPDKQRGGSWQLALFSCHLSRFVWHSISSLSLYWTRENSPACAEPKEANMSG